MANDFYGVAVHDTYEKETKDFTTADKIVVGIMIVLALTAIVFGFLRQWGIMVIFIGLVAIMGYFMIKIMFGVKNKVSLIFVALGILAIIAGIIVAAELWDIFPYYIVFVYVFISFFVAILCISIKVKGDRKKREYSLCVEAVCEMIDIKRINLFTFDDIVKAPYNAPINSNTIYKPGFHYFVNGQEYFAESSVYYGNRNTEFMEGNRVTLKVNPNNPYEIMPLEADNSTANMLMIMGIFWLFAGLVGIVVMILMAAGVISF